MARAIRKRCIALAVAGAGLTAASAAQAGLVLDLRLADGGGKFKFVSQGEVVPLQLFGIVQGTDGIDNETLYNVFAVLRSSTGGLLGDFSPAMLQPPFDTVAAQPGVPLDADGDGDLDLGAAIGGPGNTFLFARADYPFPEPQGARIGADAEEFHLASISWTVTGSSGESMLNAYRVANFPAETALLLEDGAPTTTGPTSAAGVVVVVPEPSTAAILCACGLGLGAIQRGRLRRPTWSMRSSI
ncbi:hypothetical protein [Fontivita pretiosa]|uniref:hypothetical protein n=1 Tax=Fontivita pretiosa TaxID=2989684 RepID=UPI003D17D004